MDLKSYFKEHSHNEVCIKCESREEFDRLMRVLEELGARWVNGGENPTEWAPARVKTDFTTTFCYVNVESMTLSYSDEGNDYVHASEFEGVVVHKFSIQEYVGEKMGAAFLCRSEEEFDFLFEMVLSDDRNVAWWSDSRFIRSLKDRIFREYEGCLCVGFYRDMHEVTYASPEFYRNKFGAGSVFSIPTGAKASESTITPSDDLVEFLFNLIEGGSARDT